MGRYLGDQNQLGFYYESGTYANTSGALQWIGQVQESTVDEEMGVIPTRYLGGGDRNVDTFIDGPRTYTGTFRYFPQDWKFLHFALGSNVDGGSPSPYTHTISETNSDVGNAFTSGNRCPFVSFGLEEAQKGPTDGQGFVRTFKGCMVDTMAITIAENEPISVEIGWMGQSDTFSSGNPSAITAATTRPFIWGDAQIHIPSGTVYEESTNVVWNISNNMRGPHYVGGSRDIKEPIPLNRDHIFDITLEATSQRTKTLYDQYFLGGSTFNMMVEVTDISAGAGSRDLFTVFSGCKIIDMSAPSPQEGVNEQTLTIQAPSANSTVVNDLIELYNPW